MCLYKYILQRFQESFKSFGTILFLLLLVRLLGSLALFGK